MVRNSSSISNSNSFPVEVALTRHRMLMAGLWALCWLILIDVVISVFFAMPISPLTPPGTLQKYFNYGQSVEGKIRQMIGETKNTTAVVAYAGWLESDDSDDLLPRQASNTDHLLIAAYGQSFTFRLCEELKKLDPRFELRLVKGGPGAPLSHSYAAYLSDANLQKANVVVIGILASALPRNISPTTMTAWFEAPAPFTYPRYFLNKGKLDAIDPFIHSMAEMRTALREPARWDAYVDFLRKNDPAFDSWVFESDLFDHSSLARLIRRSYGQKHLHDVNSRYWGTDGFTNADGLLDISIAIMADFASNVRARGQLPYIILFQDRGYKDHLVRAFGASLDQLGVPYFSTHIIAPSTDAQNFIPDGHFRHDVEVELARAFRVELLNKIHVPK
jgi:hypothetical protein